MEKRIITISREFGSGGRYMGKEIAKKLNLSFYDKEIIGKVAEKTGLDANYISSKGEYAPIKNFFAYSLVGRNAKGESIDDILHAAQRKIILELAEKGPCVIVGRNADYILKDREDCVNIFIHGNPKEKEERICRLYNKTSIEAQNMMHDIDKKRSIHYQYYTEQKWGLASNYTAALNSSDIGYQTCMDFICQLYKL